MTPSLDEFGLIARHLAPLATHPAAAGLQDDVAVLGKDAIKGDLVVTTDALVAGVHFFVDDTPDAVAERALRTNLSDLAAKGAKPLGYQLMLALASDLDEPWLKQFCLGLRRNQRKFAWSLLGGDTVWTPGPMTVSVTAFGVVAAGNAPRRNGGRAGDDIWVTGWIGDGALGLAVAQGQAPALPEAMANAAESKFRLPEPRVAFGQALVAGRLATASADVSDGLVADLGHIATASGLGAVVDVSSVPISAAGKAAMATDEHWLARMLTGGDDYEIVFAAPASNEGAIRGLSAQTGTAATRIGQLRTTLGVELRRVDDKPMKLTNSGFRHF